VKLVRRTPSRPGHGPLPRLGVAGRGSPPLQVVAVAASTGGPPALSQILRALPAAWPAPLLVVQHIGTGFDVGLVRYLDDTGPLPVALAEDGAALTPGRVYVCPAEGHLGVTAAARLTVTGGPPIDGYRPSANHLFGSVAATFGRGAAGVVLTGMGRDGADGLLALRQAGGLTIAQDQATSVVYGMPRQAQVRGATDAVLPLPEIARALLLRAGTPPAP
jgi:two-component system, chemotaxis family, protein-glutamate methylesterase/glutaminase